MFSFYHLELGPQTLDYLLYARCNFQALEIYQQTKLIAHPWLPCKCTHHILIKYIVDNPSCKGSKPIPTSVPSPHFPKAAPSQRLSEQVYKHKTPPGRQDSFDSNIGLRNLHLLYQNFLRTVFRWKTSYLPFLPPPRGKTCKTV